PTHTGGWGEADCICGIRAAAQRAVAVRPIPNAARDAGAAAAAALALSLGGMQEEARRVCDQHRGEPPEDPATSSSTSAHTSSDHAGRQNAPSPTKSPIHIDPP